MEKKIPRGIRNNNPLNIRRNPANHWRGASTTVTDKEFEQFDFMSFGIRAALIILEKYFRRGINTIPKIINAWAPPSENDTRSYCRRVCRISAASETTVLDMSMAEIIPRLLYAMAVVENGGSQYLSPTSFVIAYESYQREFSRR